jgi:putative endopeptidase
VNIGVDDPGGLNICQPEFISGISNLLKEFSIDDWKMYLRWNLINSLASYLSSDLVNQNFKFYGTVLSGSEKIKPRWKRVVGTVSNSLGEAVGKLFVENYFPPEAKKKMLKLVANLKESLKERIKQLDWMGSDTKKKALVKLSTMNVKIGYPDKWIDYSSLDISPDSYIKNVLSAREFDFKKEAAKIGKPVDRDEWHMFPQTVNAYYSPTMNEVVFPAAILQPPFFFLNADDAVNYGAIGAVIGHEMTHGFDDQGRQYDKNGNLKCWWSEEDSANFVKQTKPLVDQYCSYVVIDTFKLNGRMTLGENIADLGGVTVSFKALQKVLNDKQKQEKIDGFTPAQRFFLSYAQVWRQNIRKEELLKRLKTDVHSPARYRVNGVVPNVQAFYEAFNIKPCNKLYQQESKRARIW